MDHLTQLCAALAGILPRILCALSKYEKSRNSLLVSGNIELSHYPCSLQY